MTPPENTSNIEYLCRLFQDYFSAYWKLLSLPLTDQNIEVTVPQKIFSLMLNLCIGFALTPIIPGVAINIFLNAAGVAIFTLIFWTVVIRVAFPTDIWKKIFSIGMNHAAFWFAVTIFLISLAHWIEPLAGGRKEDLRLVFVVLLLIILTAVHYWRSSLERSYKIFFFILVIVSNIILGWRLIYVA